MCVTTHIRSIYTVAYPEFQRGGAVLGGGRKGGPLLVRYECVCVGGGGGMQSASSPIRKVGAFGTQQIVTLSL